MIAFLGDSLVKGTDYGGVKQSETFAALIGGPLHINAGVGSDTSAKALARLDDVGGAMTCYVMLGINDWAQGVPVEEYRANMQAIVDGLKERGCEPILLTTVMKRGSLADLQGQKAYADACYGLGAPVVDVWSDLVSLAFVMRSYKHLYADMVHLSVAGHAYVASLVERFGV